MKFPFTRFEFYIRPEEPLILPSYKGSTLRGGFGNAFRRIVCAVRSKECGGCILKDRCIYSYVFETPPPPDTRIMRKYTSAPHPFIIEPPAGTRRSYGPEEELIFGLTLVGRAIDYLPYFIYTFDELGRTGIGKGRGKYRLQSVKTALPPAQPHGEEIYSSGTGTMKPVAPSHITLASSLTRGRTGGSKLLTLNFLTPARIIYNRHLILELEFHILVRNLLRRLSLLYYFHCGGDPSAWDFRGIIEQAKGVKVRDRNLRWHDWQRYSSRQETRMNMGGFTGDITFEGDIEPFMDIIRAGEILHAGKGTAFGLGRFSIA
ncbi:MAG: CRISPR system precrRNA processing endoribonuclease RAMP protein Cas6 [Deferribacteres bacterium]|nr:CRISPR system precrRNA processing endoribonuclease RAMP protein Cas6 [Deferribacteres bacterium]